MTENKDALEEAKKAQIDRWNEGQEETANLYIDIRRNIEAVIKSEKEFYNRTKRMFQLKEQADLDLLTIIVLKNVYKANNDPLYRKMEILVKDLCKNKLKKPKTLKDGVL